MAIDEQKVKEALDLFSRMSAAGSAGDLLEAGCRLAAFCCGLNWAETEMLKRVLPPSPGQGGA